MSLLASLSLLASSRSPSAEPVILVSTSDSAGSEEAAGLALDAVAGLGGGAAALPKEGRLNDDGLAGAASLAVGGGAFLGGLPLPSLDLSEAVLGDLLPGHSLLIPLATCEGFLREEVSSTLGEDLPEVPRLLPPPPAGLALTPSDFSDMLLPVECLRSWLFPPEDVRLVFLLRGEFSFVSLLAGLPRLGFDGFLGT